MPSRSANHLRLVMPPLSGAGSPAVAVKTSLRPAGPRPAAAARRSLGDWLWHGLGAGAATASAGFATYALIFSTGQVVPSGNFNLFARSDRVSPAAAAQRPGSAEKAKGAVDPAGSPPAPERVETADNAVDFDPTGSVASQAGAAPGDRAAASRTRRGGDGPALPNFTLRDVFDGKALVESRASLSVVKPGSVLDGAGEVLSIEKRGERWVVLTANGVIAGGRR